jgi:hypothetical protein
VISSIVQSLSSKYRPQHPVLKHPQCVPSLM